MNGKSRVSLLNIIFIVIWVKDLFWATLTDGIVTEQILSQYAPSLFSFEKKRGISAQYCIIL